MNVKYISTTKKIVIMGMMIALSVIGSFIKIQGTIAFDSLAGFFCALLLGPVYGGIIGLVGHMATAFVSGFPLTLPVHIIVAVMMFLACAAFGWSYHILEHSMNFNINAIVAIIVGTLVNGPIALAVAALYMQLFMGMGFIVFFIGSIFVLTATAVVNMILAVIVYKAIGRIVVRN